MRTRFIGWFSRTQAELDAIWDAAIFVPDTNVLLHCLRHTSEVREELLRILEVLTASLWIPHRIAFEFHRRRLDVEANAADAYDRLRKEYDTIVKQARDRVRQLRAHPTISVERELAALDVFQNDFEARLAEAREKHPTEALAAASDRLIELFEGRVGDPWPADRLEAIRKEGEKRYARKIPPGYKDSGKDGHDLDKYGDLIIWKDLIEKAKADERPIIFITDDAKEDWWRIHQGKKLGARPELIEEFRAESGQMFHIYEFRHFLRLAAKRHPDTIPQDSVERIDNSLREDEEARRHRSEASETQAISSRLLSLEDERDRIIEALAGVPTFGGDMEERRRDRAALRTRLSELEVELQNARAELEALGETRL